MLKDDLSKPSYKYNQGCFYNETYTVTVDTLKLTFRGDINVLKHYYTNKGVWVNDDDSSVSLTQNLHESSFHLNVRGVELGELRMGRGGATYLTIKNDQFYYNPCWVDNLELFCSVGGFTFNNIRELHVAYDTYDIIKNINYCYFECGYKLSYGKPIHGETNNDPIGFVDSARIGALSSDTFFPMYNKQGKLGTQKKYISSYWEKNGLFYQEGKEIHRLEMRMKDKATRKLDIDLWKLNQPSYLLGLLKTCGEKRLRFVVPGEGANSTRGKKINIIDWEKLPVLEQQYLNGDNKKDEVINERAAKMVLKILYFLFLMTNRKEIQVVIEIILTVIPNLNQFYPGKKVHWVLEYNKIAAGNTKVK